MARCCALSASPRRARCSRPAAARGFAERALRVIYAAGAPEDCAIDLTALGAAAAACWPQDFAALFDRLAAGRLTGDAWLAALRDRFASHLAPKCGLSALSARIRRALRRR